jgi:DNA-binding NarL/FixJ family response regulator
MIKTPTKGNGAASLMGKTVSAPSIPGVRSDKALNRPIGGIPASGPSATLGKGKTGSREEDIRALIVDICSLTALGIGEILKSRWKSVTISHARSGEELKALLLDGTWDIILVELDLAPRSGLDLLKWARERSPGARLLAMSSGDESVHGMQALRAGSAGFFQRDSSAEDFIRAVEQVISGRPYISRRLAETLSRSLDLPKADPGELDRLLSKREHQILQALADGESIKEIGKRLAISPKTVSTYRRRILEKMHFRNDADIVKFWWSKGGAPLCTA